MLSEGAILDNFMLTKLVSQSPLALWFQALDTESGRRYLLKVARSQWQALPDTIQSVGFDFRPGKVLPWQPCPQEIMAGETKFLQQISRAKLCLPQPVNQGKIDGIYFVACRFFEGITLEQAFESGTGFTIPLLVKLLKEVDRLACAGIFHGNLQPSSILIGKQSVLLLDISQPAAVFSPTDTHLLRCLTVPEFYPFLDPRHDQLALGILLYTLVTGKHPLALEEQAGQKQLARRAGPRFAGLIDEARARGANKFVSPLLSFINPVDVKKDAPDELQELVLKTLGFSRKSCPDCGSMVEVLPGTWLEGKEADTESIFSLSQAAAALGEYFSRKAQSASSLADAGGNELNTHVNTQMITQEAALELAELSLSTGSEQETQAFAPDLALPGNPLKPADKKNKLSDSPAAQSVQSVDKDADFLALTELIAESLTADKKEADNSEDV